MRMAVIVRIMYKLYGGSDLHSCQQAVLNHVSEKITEVFVETIPPNCMKQTLYNLFPHYMMILATSYT